MAHLQYIPGDPRLVDQLVYELKSKGIFDQFRKDCISDVDTRPAYQNLRQRVENSVVTFLARQVWKPDLNKNQLREKLRKHILDGNYLEQGVERIVDQVVNPKVSSVFIPQVEDLVYNYLGISRKKSSVPVAETSNGKDFENDLLPTDLEAVSPGSVKSIDDKKDAMDISDNGDDFKMDVCQDDKPKEEIKEDTEVSNIEKLVVQESSGLKEESNSSMDNSNIPLPAEEIKLENIPEPENSPPKSSRVDSLLDKIRLPEEFNDTTDIPLPEETHKQDRDHYFKPVNSDDDDSSSDSSLRRNMSPLTPIRNFNNENSYDAQQAFDNDSRDSKNDKKDTIEPSTFRFTIETKAEASPDIKPEKEDTDQAHLSYQFNSQVNLNTFNTPNYDDSSNSNLLHIDYESDANSKLNNENKVSEIDQSSTDLKKERKHDDRRSSHKSSYRDSHRHSSSKDRRSGKPSSSKDSRKSSKDEHKTSSSKSSHKERSTDRSDKKDSRDSSKHRSSHRSSSSSTNKDSKSQRSSSSSHRHSSSTKHSDEKRSSSSSHRDKERSSKDNNSSKEKSVRNSKSTSSSHKSDKDRKSSSSSKSRQDDKDKKKDKKDTDDHYSASGRGSHSRRSTDRDSNDGSSSSKGSHNHTSSKSTENKKESKSSTSASKSDGTSTSGGSTSPSDKDHTLANNIENSPELSQTKPIIRVENHLETPFASPPRLPFVPDVTLKKPKIAANLAEARKLMKMRKFLDEEQKRMNQEAALLLEFQANVRPSLSQVYSSIPGPELEFACVSTSSSETMMSESRPEKPDSIENRNDSISDILSAAQQVENVEEVKVDDIKEVKDSQKLQITDTGKVEQMIIAESEINAENIDASKEASVKIEDTISTEDKPLIIDDNLDHEKNCENNSLLVLKENINVESVNENKLKVEVGEMKANLDETIEKEEHSNYFEVTVIAEELSENEDSSIDSPTVNDDIGEEIMFKYFAEHEKYDAELERDKFSKFLKVFTDQCIKKMHVINCGSYEENLLKDVLEDFGTFTVVNYHKNGHIKPNNSIKNIVRNLNVSTEISLPVDSKIDETAKSPTVVFSPVKSECSFELSSDYDAKLEEMVSKTSRKEIMEIILGSVLEESTTEAEMPTIDYCSESNIESDVENTMKRKICEVESSENNNRRVLTPNKIRKLSESDQITSTTEETEELRNNNVSLNNATLRSKYLGKARRVGLPRPKRTNIQNSPSSDKSVENYEHTPVAATPNGKIRSQRNKVQRYDTADLYKPKLHYLSRRNNIS